MQCIVGLCAGEAKKSACRGPVGLLWQQHMTRVPANESSVREERRARGWMTTTTTNRVRAYAVRGWLSLSRPLFENTGRALTPNNNATTKWKNTVYLRGREGGLQRSEEGKRGRRSGAIEWANINTPAADARWECVNKSVTYSARACYVWETACKTCVRQHMQMFAMILQTIENKLKC